MPNPEELHFLLEDLTGRTDQSAVVRLFRSFPRDPAVKAGLLDDPCPLGDEQVSQDRPMAVRLIVAVAPDRKVRLV